MTKNKRHFYAVEYWDGRATTTGSANTDRGKYNGRLSNAITNKIFSSKKERDLWVSKSDKRESVTLREMRYLNRGMENRYWNEMLEEMHWNI